MKLIIFSLAMVALVLCMSDAMMPWSNLGGVVIFIMVFFILKYLKIGEEE